MKLRNVLIVVKDVEKAKKFYHDLFGLDVILNNDGNVILTEGLVLQQYDIWKQFLQKDIIPENNSSDLKMRMWKRLQKNWNGFIRPLVMSID